MLSLILVAHVGIATPGYAPRPAPTDGAVLLAAKKPKTKAAEVRATVRTDGQLTEVRAKRDCSKAIRLPSGSRLELKTAGAAKLSATIFQVLKGKAQQAADSLTVVGMVGGKQESAFVMRQSRLTGVTADGASLTSSKTMLLSTTSAQTLGIQISGGTAVVVLEFFPGGGKQSAPLSFETTPFSTPVVAPAPVADLPLVAATKTASPRIEQVPVSLVEQRIKSGEIRDGLVGEYASIHITAKNGAPLALKRVSADKPLVLLVDGPGTATIRVQVLSGTTPSSEPIRLTVLENDVLLQSLEIDGSPSPDYATDQADLAASAPREYKLTVGPKTSRLSVQPSEAAALGVAVSYTFDAKPKSAAMALTLDLGDDLGVATGDLAGPTVITEVDVRERIVEKVVNIEAEPDLLGLSFVGGAVASTWGGQPAYVAGTELRVTMPFADRLFGLTFQALAVRHDLATRTADPFGQTVESATQVWAVPILAGIVLRKEPAKWFAIYITGAGGISYVRAEGGRDDAKVAQSKWMPLASASLGLEAKVGPGWLGAEGGYLYSPTATFDGIIDAYSPGGFPTSLRYRLGL